MFYLKIVFPHNKTASSTTCCTMQGRLVQVVVALIQTNSVTNHAFVEIQKRNYPIPENHTRTHNLSWCRKTASHYRVMVIFSTSTNQDNQLIKQIRQTKRAATRKTLLM